ncbi:hypothetical protein DM860_013334 [Cuscuta australis]|uniref:MORF/ORRM1/DAG-like MORF domain-containing protein n=1 Tax=Cuscuta australis TaxID=267555 RepID=A0A328DSK1_9ASTE|nr:hypothetical protein DM860_013334 [Cuscuta australis]
MLRKFICGNQLANSKFFRHPSALNITKRQLFSPPDSDTAPPNLSGGSTPAESLVTGCDYNHWLVVMDPPDGYPPRNQIVLRYIQTLSLAIGREEEARRAIYSVSTKYYYAFSCKVPEELIHTIQSLPGVRWVLPDSYLHPYEEGYGGEPFVNGEVVPYDDKYHRSWLCCEDDIPKKTHRKRKGKNKLQAGV